MGAIKSGILFNGTETPREMAQKLVDMQRQFDNRISESEKLIADLEDRVSELEN